MTYIYCILFSLIGFLIQASDSSTPLSSSLSSLSDSTIQLGNLYAKKYVLKGTREYETVSLKPSIFEYGYFGYKCFSSPSHLFTFEKQGITQKGTQGKIIRYNRKEIKANDTQKHVPSYSRGTEQNLRVLPWDAAITVVADKDLVSGKEYEKGVCIESIYNQEVKNIKLPDHKNIDIPDFHTIDELHPMGVDETNLLCNTYYAGMIVLDLAAEKPVLNIKEQDYITSIFPNPSGNGIWYTTYRGKSDTIRARYSIGHFDLRSAKTTIAIPMLNAIQDLSINPSNTRCAAITKGDQIEIFNVKKTQKRDQTVIMPDQCFVNKAMFSDDSTIVYNTRDDHSKKNNHTKNHQLHAFSLTSANHEKSALPPHIKHVDFHKNTMLIIGHPYHFVLPEIYELWF